MERAILVQVPEVPFNIPSSEISLRLFGETASEAQKRSLRRAIQSLAGKGLIVTRLEVQKTWVRDVVATARPGGGGYKKTDRGGRRLGSATMNVLSRPVSKAA